MSETIFFIILGAVLTVGEFALPSLIRNPQRYLLGLRVAVVVAIAVGVFSVIRR